MSIFEYDEEKAKKAWKEDAYAECDARWLNLIKQMCESGNGLLIPKLYQDKEFLQQMLEKYKL